MCLQLLRRLVTRFRVPIRAAVHFYGVDLQGFKDSRVTETEYNSWISKWKSVEQLS